MAALPPRTGRRNGRYYFPGLLYDLAFGRILASVRKSVSAAVTAEDFTPWLDVCCGTGSQLRGRGPDAGSGPAIGLDLHPGMIRYAAARAPEQTFIRADAAGLPFKTGTVRAVSISLGLHDKDPQLRASMIDEVKRVLARGGRLIAVDFEAPWSPKARLGALFAWAIERTAGGTHYRNGRDFLRRGGLGAFLQENGFVEVSRRDIAAGSIAVVVGRIGP
jgi:ubiquinone/menaquinone biosynthesis C-methylase UbiE